MSLTEIGVVVPGMIAKLVVSPVVKSVNKKAKTSLNPHCHCPYSLEANKKSNEKLVDKGTKSYCKKAASVMFADCPD